MSEFDLLYAVRAEHFSQTKRWLREMHAVVEALHGVRGQVLDVGCNLGRLAGMIGASLPVAAHGLDVNADAVSIAREKFPGCQFETYDGGTFPYETGRFAAVTVCHTISHVPYPNTFVDEIQRVLKPGGRLVVVIPNNNFDRLMWPVNLFNGYRHDPTVKHFWNGTQMRWLLEEAGFDVKRVKYNGEFLKWLPLPIPCWRSRAMIIAQKPE